MRGLVLRSATHDRAKSPVLRSHRWFETKLSYLHRVVHPDCDLATHGWAVAISTVLPVFDGRFCRSLCNRLWTHHHWRRRAVSPQPLLARSCGVNPIAGMGLADFHHLGQPSRITCDKYFNAPSRIQTIGGSMVDTSKRILGRLQRERVKQQKLLREFIWSLSSDGRHSKKRLGDLNGMFAGKRCFVMGNGPSLLKCDLGPLKDEVTIGSNAQYLAWDTMGFVPTFLTVEDRLVAEDRAAELCSLERPTKIFPKDLLYCLGNSKNAIFIDFVRDYRPFPKFSSDFQKIVYWGGTVSVLNLQLAYYLGCSEIYLIGFDHNYRVPTEIDNHVITSKGDDVNHIHPDYFGKGYRWHDPNIPRMEQGYSEARRFLDTNGVRVRNATIGGQLEIFERIDYGSLFPPNPAQGGGQE